MTYRVREAFVRYKKVNGVIKTITSAKDVCKFFSKRFKGETREVFYCLYLNQHNGILSFEKISMGTATGTLVDIKQILRTAVLVGAESLIFVHNHPSGDPEPSQGDKDITKKFVKACQLFELHVLDHIVVGYGGFTSLKEMGEL